MIHQACSRCGGQADLVALPPSYHGPAWRVECACGMSGGTAFGEAEAWRRWDIAHGWREHALCGCGCDAELRPERGQWRAVCRGCHHSTKLWPTEAEAWRQWDGGRR